MTLAAELVVELSTGSGVVCLAYITADEARYYGIKFYHGLRGA